MPFQYLLNEQIRNAALEPLLTPELARGQPMMDLNETVTGGHPPHSIPTHHEESGGGPPPNELGRGDRVVYINDVFFCMHQLLRLVMLDQVGNGGGGGGVKCVQRLRCLFCGSWSYVESSIRISLGHRIPP